VSLYAAFEGIPDLTGLGRESALSLLRSLPEDRLNLVKGWRTDRLPLGARELSGELEMVPPAIIVDASLHGYLVTRRAMPFVAELWPELFERAEDRAWGERNLPRLFSFYGRVAGLDSDKLKAFMGRMEALGLGSLEDMTLAGEEALSIESASSFARRISSWATPEIFFGLSEAGRAACFGIKIFLDGSLGARSAALDAPFSDGREGGLLYGD
jgi:predicted amidohydrolase YtcJ